MKALQLILAVCFIKFIGTGNALKKIPSSNGAPKIIEAPLSQTIAVITSTVILKCRASGNPDPKIEWHVNENKIQGKRFQVLPSGDLEIKELSFMDSGKYTCKAQNEYGTVQETTSLIVKDRTRIIEDSHVEEVAIGETATLRCTERHDDSVEVQVEWQMNDKPIGVDYTSKKYIKLNDNSLMIKNTTAEDSGEYICVARTVIDEARGTITLAVQDVPDAPIVEDVICKDQFAEIMWKPQGDNFAPILFYAIEYNTSVAPEKWEVGIPKVRTFNFYKFSYRMNPGLSYSFRLKAQNKRGQSQPSQPSKACTTRPDLPFMNPNNVKTEAGDPNNLIITWTPMPEITHSGPKLHYRVFWKRDRPNAEWESKDVLDWKESRLIVPVQPLFERYFVKVMAINEIGESKVPAEEIIGYSGEERPLLAPTNFKVIDLMSSTSALLKWDHVSVESLRGQFKGYKLQTWAVDEGEESLQEIVLRNNVNEFYLNKLKPSTKNFVRLCAYNSRFDGPSTVITIDTPALRPWEIQNEDY